MANQPIPSYAGPQPVGQSPVYGGAGIFTGYATPPSTAPKTPTTPPTTPPPVTPPPTPAPATPVTPATPAVPQNQNNGSTLPTPQQQNANPGTNENQTTTSPTFTTSSGQQYTTDSHGNVTYSPTPTSDLSSDQQNVQTQLNAAADRAMGIANGTIPLSAGDQAQINGLTQQFQSLIDQQKQANTNNEGVSQIRGFQTGTAEFDRSFQANTIGQVVSAGANKIATLQTQEASAIAQLTESLQNNEISQIKSAYDLYTSAHKDVIDSISQMVKSTQQALNDSKIADVISSGVTDPAGILKQLQANGSTGITAKDITDAIANLSPDAKSILDTATTAAQNGASPDTVKKIMASKNTSEALTNAAGYLQSASGTLGDYLQYKKDQTAAGLTPLDYTAYQDQQNKKAEDIKNSESYSNAYNSEAGKAAADIKYGVGGITPDSTPTDVVAGGITQATGLDLVTFNYLTQGTGALTRMSATQRAQVMKQANDFLNKNGIDVSTFQSQYKSYNDVLQKNIERANNTKIFAGEVDGTASQFISDIGDSIGNLKPASVGELFLKGQTNDPTVQKYAFDLQTMQNDLAGYYAASRGASSPDDSDLRAAATVIQNGISTKSVQAFKDSISSNEGKVTGVVNQAVTNAQKSVWELFGAGDKFAPKSLDPKGDVTSWVKSNPAKADQIASMYEVPGTNDQDVLDYINKYLK